MKIENTAPVAQIDLTDQRVKFEAWAECYDMDKHSGYIKPERAAPSAQQTEAPSQAAGSDGMEEEFEIWGLGTAIMTPRAAGQIRIFSVDK